MFIELKVGIIMKEYYEFFTPIQNSIIIKRSEFITNLVRVTSEKEIEEKLKAYKKQYYDATHNCYAYIIGTKLDEKYKCSDDGEPSKTAGAPILDSLQKNNLTNCLCVVTRYFGGIKLGAGGLVRAYSESASEAIKQINDLQKIIEKTTITFNIAYDLVNQVLKAISNYTIISKDFLMDVRIKVELPKDDLLSLKDTLINLTNGKITFSE